MQAHQAREEQLSSAAQTFKHRMHILVRKYERLLLEYRKLLQHLEDYKLLERDEIRPFEDVLARIVGTFPVIAPHFGVIEHRLILF